MNEILNKNQYNEIGQRHGYWEEYWFNGNLSYKGNYINGQKHGNWEGYFSNSKLWSKENYINGKRHGYWEEYFSNKKHKTYYL